MNAPARPVLRYHGGKWLLAPWIIGFFPPHRVYVEPFGGGASVLLRKEPALTDIYGDLDADVVNLFRVLRGPEAPRLLDALGLTPYAREEFDLAFEPTDEPVERARRLIVRSFMSGGSRGVLDVDRTMAGFNGSSARSRGRSPQASHAQDWARYPDGLPAVIARLRNVVIEHRSAFELIPQHDSGETLFYVDPPYLSGVRSDRARKAYRHELSDEDHRRLAASLRQVKGMVVLSGYPCALYDSDLYPDWRRYARPHRADGARERTEVVWLNPACAAALDRARAQGSLLQVPA